MHIKPEAFALDYAVFTLVPEERSDNRRTIPTFKLSVVLAKRGNPDDPFYGKWALPGALAQPNKTINEGAVDKMYEKLGIGPGLKSWQFRVTYSEDPRGWIPSLCYLVVADRMSLTSLKAGKNISDVMIVPVEEALSMDLAFNHNETLSVAVDEIRHLARTTLLIKHFLPPHFTSGYLLSAWKAVLPELDVTRNNFTRDFIKKKKFVTPVLDDKGTEMTTTEHSTVPVTLYKFEERDTKINIITQNQS